MAYVGIQICRVAYWNDFLGAREAVLKAYENIQHTTERDSLQISGLNSMYTGDEETGFATVKQLLEKYPDDKEALIFLANAYHYNSHFLDLNKSIETHRRVLDIDPLWKPSYNGLAYAYDELGDFEQSLWAINKYIELAPNEPNPYDSRAEILARNGQAEDARASYLRALSIDADFLPSLQGAIGLSIQLGDFRIADSLIEAMKNHQNPAVQSRGFSQDASLALYQGRFRDALGIYDRRLKLDSQSEATRSRMAGVYINRGYILSFLGETDKALAETERARRLREETLTPDQAQRSIWDDQVRIMAEAGRIAEADSIHQLLGEDMDEMFGVDSTGHLRLGQHIQFAAGNFDSALTLYQKSLGRRTEFTEHVRLGQTYAELRRFRDAQREYDLAADLFDGSRLNNSATAVLYYYYRAQVYDRSGKTQQAAESYQKFLTIWKDADPGIEEVEDAKRRLAELQA
jgi:tetratricopeptide (TPR) repeat protein